VGSSNKLDATLGNRAGSTGFELGTDLIDHDDFRHVVLDGFDHDAVLSRGRGDLHAAGAPDCRMRNVSVTGDLVAGVDDDHAAMQVVRKYAGDLSQHGRFSNTGTAKKEETLSGFDQITNDGNGSIDRATDAAGEAYNLPAPVANGGDPVKRALDAGAVVITELADARGNVFDLLTGDIHVTDVVFSVLEAGFGTTAEIHDDLDKASAGTIDSKLVDTISNTRRQDRQKVIQIVGDLVFGNGILLEMHCWFLLCTQSMLLCCDQAGHNTQRCSVNRLIRNRLPWGPR
jgi:hypothetical protein